MTLIQIGTLALVALVTLILPLPGRGVAATFEVSITGDTADGRCDRSCSLRDAILASNQRPGSDTVTLPAGTYVLTLSGRGEDQARTGDLDILDDLTITGSGSDATTIDAAGIDRAFYVHPNASLRLEGVTVRNGSVPDSLSGAGGGAINNGGVLVLTRCLLTGNSAGRGGAIVNEGQLEVSDCVLRGNAATEREQVFFPRGGGGIFSTGGAVIVIGSEVNANTARSNGGAIYADSGALTLTDTNLEDNSAGEDGGAVYLGHEVVFEASSSRFGDNSAQGNGGGVASRSQETATLVGCSVEHNSVEQTGAGIFTTDGKLMLRDSTLSRNFATGDGGGIRVSFHGEAELINSTLSANGTSEGSAAGIRNDGHTMLTNCTITDNTLFTGMPMTFGIANFGSAVIANTILADRGRGQNCGGSHAVQSGGFNLDDDESCEFAAPGDLSMANASLAPLGDYGGLTLTQPPCTGFGKPHSLCDGASPAIDAGDDALCPPADQRGSTRPFGSSCDIGAVESQIAPEPPSPTRTASPTPRPPRSPSPTPTLGPCYGDCDSNGRVSVDEIVRGVSVALGIQPISICPAFDVNDDGALTVDELVRAVNVALNGCVANNNRQRIKSR